MRAVVADLCADVPCRTPSEVLALIRWLPDDAAFTASHAGGLEHRGWSTDRYIAKSIFDAVQVLTYVNMRIAAGKKGRSIPQPKQFPSPEQGVGTSRPQGPRINVAALAALDEPKG